MSFITDLLTGNIVATGSIVPSSNTSTLGSAEQGWGNIYIANGNITVIEPDISNITGLVWDQALAYSTSPTDQLYIGEYGLTNGISAPYTVVQFTTVPSPPLQIGDLMTGNNVPYDSYVLFVGAGLYNNIVIISQTVNGNIPPYGTQLNFTRAIVPAALSISTQTGTDISLNPGADGKVVVNGNVVPNDNSFNLGERLDRWTNLYLNNNIYVTDQTLGYDNILNANNGYFNILGTTGFTVGQFIFSGPNIYVQSSSTDIFIGKSTDTGAVQFNRTLAVTNTITGTDTFSVTRDGLVTILTPKTILTTESALSIVGTSSGSSQARNFSGTLLQMTAQDSQPARVSMDSFGSGVYPVIAGRSAQGTVLAPSPTLNGDTLFRVSGQGYGTTGYVGSIARVNLQAAQTFTDAYAGTRIRFQTTPVNSNVIQTVTADFTANGLSFVGNPTGRITFPDSTVQSTAWLGTTPAGNITGLAAVATSGCYANLSNTPTISAVGHSGNFGDLQAVPPLVYSITVGTGLTQTGGTSGNIGINATGVANVTAAPGYGQIGITDIGSKNLVLSLPQPLATNSLVTFGNLTITGNLTVNGTFTTTGNATVDSKTLTLANTATSSSQIDGGGIILGSGCFAKSITYSLGNNYWDTDSAGLNTLQLFAENTQLNFLNVTTQAHIGLAYQGYDYPNSQLQIDSDFNSYSQIVSTNHNSGTCASTDFVATSNTGNNDINYIDMGINGGNFSSPCWTINGPNDGYLYVNSGNLAIGTSNCNSKIVFFTGNTFAANSAGYISCGGRWVLGTTDDTVTKLQVSGNASFTGNISTKAVNVVNIIASGTTVIGAATPGIYRNANLQIFGNVNRSMQVIAQNTNACSAASTDIVATANNGTCSSNYIDMGINSSTYSQPNYTAQYPNDGYLFTSNSNLVISTAQVGSRLVFTTDGINTNNLAGFVTGQRWILGGTDDLKSKLQVTGNVAVTGNFIVTNIVSAGVLITTSIGTTGDVTVTGTARVNALIANTSIQTPGTMQVNSLFSNSTSISSSLNVTGGAQINSLTTNSLATSQTLNVIGLATVNSLQSNNVITTNGLQSAAQITVSDLVANNTIQGNTLNILAAAQVNSLTTNVLAASQTLTVIGKAFINTVQANIWGAFGQNVTVGSTNAALSTTTGALVVTGGMGVGGNIIVGGNVGIGTSQAATGNAVAIYNGNLFIAGNLRLGNTSTSIGGIQFADGTFMNSASGGFGGSGYSGYSGAAGSVGSSGYSGLVGASGYSGYSGISGFSGYSGISGFSGYSGLVGNAGLSGYSGVVGSSGFSGYSGLIGISGYSGTAGTIGLSGYSGISGFSGYSGISGFSGYSGITGFSGYSGAVGTSGYSGAVGTSGYSGISGFSGYSGAVGNTGLSGYSGISGFSGNTGLSGYSGINGFSGYSGAVGTSGYSGAVGNAGFSGYSGAVGTSGYSGTVGTSGYSGTVGTSGYSGAVGTSGYSGSTGPVYGNTNVTSYLSGSVIVGNLYVVNTTVSTSASTGALVVNGGLGITGNIYAASSAWLGNLSITNTTVSTSNTTGALTVAGGVGIVGNISVGNLSIGAGTTSMAPINITTGVLKSSATSGSIEYDGEIFYATPSGAQRGLLPAAQFYQLGQTRTLPLVAQPINNSLFGVNVSVTGGTKYQYELIALISKAGAITPSIQYALGGSAALTEHDYLAMVSIGSANTTVQSASAMMANLTASFTTMVPVSNAAPTGSTNYRVRIEGVIGVNTSGNVQPMISLSTGTPTAFSVAAGSYMKIWPTATTTTGNIAIGNWVASG